jgi:hypothetical protein
MKVTIQAPQAGAAEVRCDPQSNTLTVAPAYARGSTIHDAAHITVLGNAGKKRRYLLTVSVSTGKLALTEESPLDADFDRLTESDQVPAGE